MPTERRLRGRVLRVVGVAVALLLAGSVAYAHERGFLQRSYWAAVGGCGDREPTMAIQPPDAKVHLVPVSDAVDAPTAMAFHPTLPVAYVTGRSGLVHTFDGTAVSAPILDLTKDTSIEYDRGLLGAAVDPDGHWLYLYRTDAAHRSRLAAWPLDATGAIRSTTGTDILVVPQPDTPHHKGGGLAFGPDGLLYLSLGDGGKIGDRDGNAQDPHSLLGKVLRIDPHPGAHPPYAIPPGNPIHDPDRGRPEVLALGLRNPFRLSIDAADGDLWLGDVGHDCMEEIDVVTPAAQAGANFEWNRQEGTRPFVGGHPARHVPPLFSYPHEKDRSCAVVGGAVYRGSVIPQLKGRYVFGDFCSRDLVALEVTDDHHLVAARALGVDVPALLGIVPAPDGQLYVLSYAKGIFRLAPG